MVRFYTAPIENAGWQGVKPHPTAGHSMVSVLFVEQSSVLQLFAVSPFEATQLPQVTCDATVFAVRYEYSKATEVVTNYTDCPVESHI